MNHKPWQSIFDTYRIDQHNFRTSPYVMTAEQIKQATKHFQSTTEREVRVLCQQDTREDRPLVFQEQELFILPIKNGAYAIIKGEGYVDIPEIPSQIDIYTSSLDFSLETSVVRNSEMQHVDFAFASSLIRTFLQFEIHTK